MKMPFAIFPLAALAFTACSLPDPQLAEAEAYWARKGDEITPTPQKVEQVNPEKGSTPHLSTSTPPPKN